MRFLATLLLLSSCAATPTPLPYHYYDNVVGDEYRAGVMLFTTCKEDGEIRKYRGTGSAVGPRQIITAAHVVFCGENNTEPAEEVRAQLLDGASFPVRVEALATGVDVARLKVADPSVELPVFSSVAEGDAGVGEWVCALHAVPLWGRACGEVLYDTEENVQWIKQVADYGHSGSGVYNVYGKLVGVLVMTRICSTEQHCYYGVEPLSKWKMLMYGF